MHHDLTQALDQCVAVNEIAERLYLALRGPSLLDWKDAGISTREWYRARARQAVRSCQEFAVTVGVEEMAKALCRADDKRWSDIRADDRARYHFRAWEAYQALRFHLAETAYPEARERAMAEGSHVVGKTLGKRADDTRLLAWKGSL